MRSRISEYRLFWRQFRDNFHDTGAVLPSGGPLARALVRQVARQGQAGRPRKILEAGPGTGAVTRHLVRHIAAHDQLDLVEINPGFADNLRRQFADHPEFQHVAPRARVFEQSVDALGEHGSYDAIVSGLPHNNFDPQLVEQVLEGYRRLLRPGGTLSFFQYIGMRPAKQMVTSRSERARLQAVGDVLDAWRRDHEVARDWVWLNAPPAWVHHWQFPQAAA